MDNKPANQNQSNGNDQDLDDQVRYGDLPFGDNGNQKEEMAEEQAPSLSRGDGVDDTKVEDESTKAQEVLDEMVEVKSGIGADEVDSIGGGK